MAIDAVFAKTSSRSTSSGVKARGESVPTGSTPEHPVREDERHSEEALDPFLAEDRVEVVGVVDVVEHDRTALGGDAAREPCSERDADALLHLLLEPDRRAGDELVARLVEQEDGGRVRLERVSDPCQQLGQELVEVEVRQRGVGDELQPSKPFDIAGGGHVAEDTTGVCERANVA